MRGGKATQGLRYDIIYYCGNMTYSPIDSGNISIRVCQINLIIHIQPARSHDAESIESFASSASVTTRR